MKKRILFVCGSQNQTTQMHAIAKHLEPDFACVFSPFFGSGALDWLARRGMLDFTILGGHWRTAAFAYFAAHRLPTDDHARRGPYDLVVTCQDIVFPETLRGQRIVLVQEGMTDPEGPMFDLVKRFRFLPPWLASTAGTGLSDAYETFCVASHGYRELFEKKGVRPHKLVVTGIPNFDDLARWGSRRTMTFRRHGRRGHERGPLARADREATRPHEREHTTPYLWDQPEPFRVANVLRDGPDLSRNIRLTIDYAEDHALLSRVFDELHIPGGPAFPIDAVVALAEDSPEIFRINACHAGISWYRHHAHELRTIRPDDVRNASSSAP